MTARLWLLVSVVAAVQDQKANRALTTLDLAYNDCGDAGAAALAKALKATVFDVFIVSVQGVCLLLPKMSLHVVRTVGVVRLL